MEEYPDYPKGRCILLLQYDKHIHPVHVLWRIPKGYDKPVVLVISCRPDPKGWDKSFLHRIKYTNDGKEKDMEFASRYGRIYKLEPIS